MDSVSRLALPSSIFNIRRKWTKPEKKVPIDSLDDDKDLHDPNFSVLLPTNVTSSYSVLCVMQQ